MTISTRAKTNGYARKLRGLARDIDSKRTWLEVGGTAKSIIVHRTLLGRSVSGAAFAPYSTQRYYAPISRRPPGYPSPTGGEATKTGKSMRFDGGYKQYHQAMGFGAVPTLSVSGQMLGDIQVRAGRDRATLFFGSALSAAKAHGHHYGANALPEREWFDIAGTPVERKKFAQTLTALLREYASRNRLRGNLKGAGA